MLTSFPCVHSTQIHSLSVRLKVDLHKGFRHSETNIKLLVLAGVVTLVAKLLRQSLKT